jgi:hypothetical protein
MVKLSQIANLTAKTKQIVAYMSEWYKYYLYMTVNIETDL